MPGAARSHPRRSLCGPELMHGLTRAYAVVGKELLVVVRRPSALATLVIGPVVILALFGLSYIGQPPVRAVLVVPANSGLPTDARAYDLNQQGVLQIVGTRPTLASARQALANRTADRKSTRLNSSHRTISYAVFCLK